MLTWPEKTKKEKDSAYFVKDLEISMYASTMCEREEKRNKCQGSVFSMSIDSTWQYLYLLKKTYVCLSLPCLKEQENEIIIQSLCFQCLLISLSLPTHLSNALSHK